MRELLNVLLVHHFVILLHPLHRLLPIDFIQLLKLLFLLISLQFSILNILEDLD